MSSSAYLHTKVDGTEDFLETFNHLHKFLLGVFEKVSTIYNTAANEMLSLVETSNKKLFELTRGATKSYSYSFELFINKYLTEVENQASFLKNFQIKSQNSVVKPLSHVVREKKKMWRACFRYSDSFIQQISKQETSLHKYEMQYSGAVEKINQGDTTDRALQKFHDLHNTYVLQSISVESINNVFCTKFLPHNMHSIEQNHEVLNGNYRDHLNDMLSLQDNTWSEIKESVNQIQKDVQNLNLMQDLQTFVRISKDKMKDTDPSGVTRFSLAKVDQPKVKTVSNLDSNIFISETTRPNLQRRLASLQQQTQQLEQDISVMRESSQSQQLENKTLNNLITSLIICDKEAHLSVLLKQKELYTPTIIDFLGPMPENILLKKAFKSTEDLITTIPSDGPRLHEFTEPLVMLASCFYCEKPVILKGCICELCKIAVHKKCATNIKFCEFTHPVNETTSLPLPHRRMTMLPYKMSSLHLEGDIEKEDVEYSYIIGPRSQYHLKASRSPTKLLDEDCYVFPDFNTAQQVYEDNVYEDVHDVFVGKSDIFISSNPRNDKVEAKDTTEPIEEEISTSQPKCHAKPPTVPPKPDSSSSPGGREPNKVKLPECVINLPTALITRPHLVKNKPFMKSTERLQINKQEKLIRARYDFTKENEKEISIKEGDDMTLMYEKKDWLMVKTKDGEGLVPASYVEFI